MAVIRTIDTAKAMRQAAKLLSVVPYDDRDEILIALVSYIGQQTGRLSADIMEDIYAMWEASL